MALEAPSIRCWEHTSQGTTTPSCSVCKCMFSKHTCIQPCVYILHSWFNTCCTPWFHQCLIKHNSRQFSWNKNLNNTFISSHLSFAVRFKPVYQQFPTHKFIAYGALQSMPSVSKIWEGLCWFGYRGCYHLQSCPQPQSPPPNDLSTSNIPSH